MRSFSSRGFGIAVAVLLTTCGFGRADTAPDPLRLIPDNADLILRIDQPRRLLETLMELDAFQQLQQLQAVKEAYDSTDFRRFMQLVTYLEKELGSNWRDLLDRISGDGAVVAVKFAKQPPPVVAVVQGNDEALLKRFVEMIATITEGELARQETKDRLERKSHRDINTFHIGKDFHAAVLGSALVFANGAEHLNEVIDHHLDGKKNMTGVASVAEARKRLPANSFAWAWMNMESVRQVPGAKEVFTHPRNDPNLTVAFGGWLDVARRASYLCGAIYPDGDRFITTVRIPSGREGSPPELAVHIPPSDAQGCMPLLEPKGVLYSTSYYMDISKFWECRDKLFNETIAKAFDEADKKTAPFLAGNKLSTLLTQAGTHQRFVVAYDPDSKYPKGPFGFVGKLGYAVVADMHDPALGKSLETIIRGAGFLARTFAQVKVKLVEEKYQDVSIVGYRQEGNGPQIQVNAQNNPLAYAPSPSFAVVGNQLVAASTLEMMKELIDILQKEAKASPTKKGSASRSRFYGDGGAELLNGIQDVLLAQTILDQALSPADAREEVRRGIDWVRGLGVFDLESEYGANEFRYDVIFAPQKRKSVSGK